MGKVIVACSDGRNRTLQALETMDEMGYVNIVGLRGGYNLWNRQWDAKLRTRNLPGVFKEDYIHGADGCGVHATGAGFQNQDAFQYADWRDTTEWIDTLEPVRVSERLDVLSQSFISTHLQRTRFCDDSTI